MSWRGAPWSAIVAACVALGAATPARAEEVPVFLRATTELRCAQLDCACARGPLSDGDDLYIRNDEGCFEVTCRCADDHLEASDAEEEEALPPPSRPVGLADDLGAAFGGELLGRGAFGFRLGAGYPVFDLRLSYGVHRVFELGVGYRSFWGLTHSGYLSLRFLLYRAARGTAAISLGILGGYTGVTDDYYTVFVGGDSGYGELHIELSVGRYGHAFTAALGTRLSWVRERTCFVDEWGWSDCWNALYEDGEAGLLVTPFVDVGYAVRFSSWGSFYLTSGIEVRIGADNWTASPRAAMGIVFDW